MAEKGFDPNDLPGRQLKNGCVEIVAIRGLQRLPQLNRWLGGCYVRANLAEERHGVRVDNFDTDPCIMREKSRRFGDGP